MASVLSGWCYGYNIFNIANFIEYHDHHQQQQQPLPKRRKLVDNNNAYMAVDHRVHHGGYSHHQEVVLGRKKAGSGHHHHQHAHHHHHHHGHQQQTVNNSSSSSCPIYRPFSISSGRGAADKAVNKNSKQQQLLLSEKQLAQLSVDASAAAVDDTDSSSCLNNNDAGRTTIEHIFPELLCLIFERLDLQSKGRAAQVCSRWRDSVYQKSVWRGCEARLHLRRSNPTLFPSLARRGIRRVQVLSLRKSLRDLVTGLPNLISLNLSGCYNLSDAALDTALNRDLPSLRVLNLSLCKDITDNSLGRIATHCPGLEWLELGGCTRITNTGLLLISWGLKNIRRLNLRSCWQISDHGIGHLAGQLGGPASAAAATAGGGGGSSGGGGGGAKSLEELSLQDCQKLTDESLRHIAEGLPRMARLNLSFCLSVTDTGLKSLARMASLRDLNLRSCDNVSDIGLGFLGDGSASAAGGGGASGQSALRRLDVSFCDRVTDSAMTHVASGLTQLVSLSLSACAISDAGIARIAKDLKGLEVLNIGQCVRLTDKAIETIGEQMVSLRSIDLYGCTKISASGLARLAKCRQLEVVNRGLWHQF